MVNNRSVIMYICSGNSTHTSKSHRLTTLLGEGKGREGERGRKSPALFINIDDLVYSKSVNRSQIHTICDWTGFHLSFR